MNEVSGTWSRCLDCAALSDIGLRRSNNQDAYAIALAADQGDFANRGHFFMVADGMGAHAAGELASKMATDIVALTYRKLLDKSPPEALLSAILDANRQIHARGEASADFRGMGTTSTMLVLLPAGVLLAHVGDSRAYRLRGKQVHQLTFDHSLIWEVQASGQLTEPAVANYISKNIITRSLGPNATVQIDLEGPLPVEAGDTFLLCSDGLSNQVKDDEIGMILGCLPPAEAVQALVDMACLRGGPDNITALVVKVLGPQIADATAQRPPALPTAYANCRPVHPHVWILLGVAVLATAGSAAMGYIWLAVLSFLVAGATLTAALIYRCGGGGARAPWEQRHFGRGPYVTADGTPTLDLVARLTGLAQQLRAGSAAEGWTADWTQYDRQLAEAQVALKADDLPAVARAQLRAISSVMSQLRRQPEVSSDSGVIRL